MTKLDVGDSDALSGLAREEAPVLEALAKMHLDTLEFCELDPTTYHLVRFAALAAADAPPMSYLVNVGAATEAGVTVDDLRSVLVAVAPIIGSARVTAAAGNVLRAAGLAVALDES
jgi:alkylhydroperoxidase/carboxymuconolactone decarboxylase family protein YurZ